MTEEAVQYKVYLTPLKNKDVYVSEEIDISDYVEFSGIGSIVRQVDNGDFDIGVFTYSNVDLKIVNSNGKFSQPDDYRSFFEYSRDLSKIRIEFLDREQNVFTTFKGIINDEATTQDFNKRTMKFSILSYDSILKKIIVPAGLISNGDTFKEAFIKILNRVEVLSLLNFDEANVNPTLNLQIDIGNYFDNLTSRNALNDILLASNSILFIDDSDNIIIKERKENLNIPFEIYNDGNLESKENIFNIKSFNNGLQRSFNSIKVNNVVANNDKYIETFNLRQKEFTLDFITNITTLSTIASNILNEFKAPKKEGEVEVSSEDFQNIQLLDVVAFPYESFSKLYQNDKDIAMYEQETYGNFNYPIELRELNLSPQIKYKTIAIKNDPKNKKIVLKIRQTGITISDGYFDWIQDNEDQFILDNNNQRIEATNG